MTENKIKVTKVESEEPKMERVVKTEAKIVKRGLVERLVIGMIGPNGLKGVATYVGREVVGPAIKNMVADGLTSALNMALFGDNNRGTNTPRNAPGAQYRSTATQQVNYHARYATGATAVPKRDTYARTNRVDEYMIADRRDAVIILDGLKDSIAQYGTVSVADYYDLIGVESTYTDNNYGWDDLATAAIIASRGGFIIKLPPVLAL